MTGGSDGRRTDGGPLADVTDLDHVALRVGDIDRALGFYRDLLGMAVRDRGRFEAGEVPYVAVVAGGRHLHLVPTDEEFDVGGEHVCLLLRSSETDARAELDALLADLRDAGVTVEADEPRERYGAYGRAWAAYVRDPDGRRVELKVH
jgi:catechol 2,3-dioxygenase-like lactoylglutathione lyase family enzyme